MVKILFVNNKTGVRISSWIQTQIINAAMWEQKRSMVFQIGGSAVDFAPLMVGKIGQKNCGWFT